MFIHGYVQHLWIWLESMLNCLIHFFIHKCNSLMNWAFYFNNNASDVLFEVSCFCSKIFKKFRSENHLPFFQKKKKCNRICIHKSSEVVVCAIAYKISYHHLQRRGIHTKSFLWSKNTKRNNKIRGTKWKILHVSISETLMIHKPFCLEKIDTFMNETKASLKKVTKKVIPNVLCVLKCVT